MFRLQTLSNVISFYVEDLPTYVKSILYKIKHTKPSDPINLQKIAPLIN